MPSSSISPIQTFQLSNDLSLSPRLKLHLTFFRLDPFVKPIDEWQLKQSLLQFLHSPPLSIPTIPEPDLQIKKHPDLKKRKLHEPVANGTLFVRDLSFLEKKSGEEEEGRDEWKVYLEWREGVVERLSGVEMNIEGVEYRLEVEVPEGEDFERVKRSWEEDYEKKLLGHRGNASRGMARRADTIVIKGVPSRWFAEPRVSSKPSMLVTHTIFSALGKIRNLNVAGNDDLGEKAEETKAEILSGLQCKVWVQFDSHDDFCNAMKMLCGRSMQKQGSRLKVDYEVAWDRDGFFQNSQQRSARSYVQDRGGQMPRLAGDLRNEAPRHRSQVVHSNFDGPRAKRFRD